MEKTITIRTCDGCRFNDRDDDIVVKAVAPFEQVLHICADCERRGMIACVCGRVHHRSDKCPYD